MRAIRCWLGITLLLTATLLVACGGGATPAPTASPAPPPTPAGTAAPDALAQGKGCPSAAGPLEDAIVVNSDFDLAGVAADGKRITQLTDLPLGQGLRAVAPAWSPDGQTLAFTLFFMSPDPALGQWLQIGMICGLDRQTGQGRILVRTPANNESLEEASWTADGQALLVTHIRYVFDDQGVLLTTETNVARAELASGALTPLVRDGTRPALSPDGQRLAYVQLVEGGYKRVLMVAQGDGQQARPLLGEDSPLASFEAPRWSPDGLRLLFTASTPLSASLPLEGAQTSEPAGSWLEKLLSVPVARAHGDPAQLWVVGADGQGLEQLTQGQLDDPRAAWSADGQQVAYITTLGSVMVLDLKSRKATALTDPGLAGVIDWRWH